MPLRQWFLSFSSVALRGKGRSLTDLLASVLTSLLALFLYLLWHLRKSCHLATLSAWADTIHGWAPWSSTLHYINPTQDAPPEHCEYGEHGFVNPRNVVTALYNYTSILSTPIESSPSPGNDSTRGSHPAQIPFTASRDFALRMVTHLVGDMSQPLHLTGRARGGNDIWVTFEGRKAKLHSVWDSQIILSQIRELANYTTPLRSARIESALLGRTYDAYTRWILKEGLGQPALVGEPETPSWWSERQQAEWISCPLPPLNPASPTASIQAVPVSKFGVQPENGNTVPVPLSANLADHRLVFSSPLSSSSPHPEWKMGEGEETICALGWTWEAHPLVCKYGFAAPVPASLKLSEADEDDMISTYEVVLEDDGVDVPESEEGPLAEDLESEASDEVDAERRRRRRRRRGPHRPPSDPPSRPPPLPELRGAYLDRINDDKVVQMQLAKSGIRLAGLLNSIFLDEALVALPKYDRVYS